MSWNALIVALCVVIGVVVSVFIYRRLKKIARKEGQIKTWTPLIKRISYPLASLIILSSISFVYPLSAQDLPFNTRIVQSVLFNILITWLLIVAIQSIKVFVLSKYDFTSKDNLKARKIHTQLIVIERMLTVLVLIFAFGIMLLLFPKIRQVGVSLLASAGIAGIIIGFAAQKSIALFLAGFQIAFTQPIRLDDVVIVEGEWGWIEEITLTYVVVRIWDKRRLIVPITYFIEKPFQNWTRTSAEILGTVFIYVDYGFPVNAMREELTKILDSADEWDRKVNVLQVTGLTEKTMEIRALMSASDSPSAWDLRVKVREKLIDFVQREYPQYLAQARINLEKE